MTADAAPTAHPGDARAAPQVGSCAADVIEVDPAHILRLLRPLVIVVGGTGTIESVHGGYGGFLGHDPASLVGVDIFDYVAPYDVDEIATYFVESAGESLETIALPLPFRVDLIGADGLAHPVDVIPTGEEGGSDLWGWVVALVPVAMNASVSRSLDAEMAGAPRGEVRRLLADELAVDNAHYTSRGFLVDVAGADVDVVTRRADDTLVADAIRRAIVEGDWRPWDGLAHGETAALCHDALPEQVAGFAARRDWRRISVTAVHLDGELVAAFLLFGSVPDDYPLDTVKTNIANRFRNLADMTALITGRWRERDRLLTAATRDSLTGLANRDAFSDALAVADERSSVLYIDIDRFKEFNDRYGHQVGDRVLVAVADRIVGACRPEDVVARFGGDEFVVLLRGVDPRQARAIGERVVAAVDAPFEVPGVSEHLTVSVGLAPRLDSVDALDRADRAMLRAKREGRARVVSA